MNNLQRSADALSPRVLVMEDELSVAKGLEMILSEDGYHVDLAMTGRAALENVGRKDFDVLVADLRLPDISGLDVIHAVKEKHPDTIVVVITGYPSVSSAVDSMKTGAFDYLAKPFTDDQIRQVIARAIGERKVGRASPGAYQAVTPEEQLIQKREVSRVLNRTAEDDGFWKELMEGGSDALIDYPISMEAKAAIASGDLKWLNENVGELTQKQLMFIYSRLEREAW